MNPQLFFRCLSIVLFSISLGCAGVSVKRDTLEPIPNENWLYAFFEGFTESFKPKGIRYYQQANFILVYTDGQGGVTTQHLILPDTSKKLSARPYAVLASLGDFTDTGKAALDFQNGMLTGVNFSADSTAVPAAIITTATEIAKTFVESGGPALLRDGQKRDFTSPAVFMFRILYTEDGYKLSGSDGYEIKITS